MKTLSILFTCIAFGGLVAHSQAAEAARSTGQVTLRASDKTVRPERAKKEDDKGDGKKDKKPKSETVTKTIDVNISAAQTINGPLKIVTFWYARDVKTKKSSMAKKEETEVSLDASKTAKMTVPAMDFTFTPAYTKKVDGVTEKFDAEGQTYYGWVIRAYEGETLVGESASAPPLLKMQD